jgi:hypothetical protein
VHPALYVRTITGWVFFVAGFFAAVFFVAISFDPFWH